MAVLSRPHQRIGCAKGRKGVDKTTLVSDDSIGGDTVTLKYKVCAKDAAKNHRVYNDHHAKRCSFEPSISECATQLAFKGHEIS